MRGPGKKVKIMSSEKKQYVGFEVVNDYEVSFFSYKEWFDFITFKIYQFMKKERIIEGMLGYAIVAADKSKVT